MKYLRKNSKLLALESKIHDKGFSFIAGVDEVGRGPLAGPVVAAAVILPTKERLPAVDDSKKLNEKQREELYKYIINIPGIDYSIIEITPDKIDEVNILRATHIAMIEAVNKLQKVDFILVDGLPVKGFSQPSEAVVKGDSKSASIAAASIIAKVHRDNLMKKYDKVYPKYGFAKHKGYGTKAHLEALQQFGVTEIHRKSFAPVRDIITPPPEQLSLF
ncbi:ribonuclease HII [Lentisphaerota bacterium WC36G]|nr:ribonuclease HII [Lentisphaerae bacterium WC36]